MNNNKEERSTKRTRLLRIGQASLLQSERRKLGSGGGAARRRAPKHKHTEDWKQLTSLDELDSEIKDAKTLLCT
jgi:hypothetical protein